MAITTVPQFDTSKKHILQYTKTTALNITGGNSATWTMFNIAGNPAPGVIAYTGAAQTAGIVPTSADTGFPKIPTFGAGNTGYLTQVEATNTVASRLFLYDLLYYCGSYNASGANQNLTGQPSFVSRLPGGSYVGTKLFLQIATAVTGTQNLTVTYTNQSGVSGRTATLSTIGPAAGNTRELALTAGDTGVQSIQNVTSTATSGTFNILIMRPLFKTRILYAPGTKISSLQETGMPTVYATSAIYPLLKWDTGTVGGIVDLEMVIAEG
jgi:hypothetical protein